MDLLSTLAQYPKEDVNKIKIRDKSIFFPIEVDIIDFYNSLKEHIKTDKLTTEKAIYAARLVPKKQFKSYKELMLTHISFPELTTGKQSPFGF